MKTLFSLYRRSLKILEKTLGPEHPNLTTTLNNPAELYKEIGKKDKAKKFKEHAKAIRSKNQ